MLRTEGTTKETKEGHLKNLYVLRISSSKCYLLFTYSTSLNRLGVVESRESDVLYFIISSLRSYRKSIRRFIHSGNQVTSESFTKKDFQKSKVTRSLICDTDLRDN